MFQKVGSTDISSWIGLCTWINLCEVLTLYLTDLTLQTLPPPAGGAAVLTILNVMDLYGVTEGNKTDNLTYHRFIEV